MKLTQESKIIKDADEKFVSVFLSVADEVSAMNRHLTEDEILELNNGENDINFFIEKVKAEAIAMIQVSVVAPELKVYTIEEVDGTVVTSDYVPPPDVAEITPPPPPPEPAPVPTPEE